eukprot:TRINITY_DN8266_c0_g1_i1.p1 TRINITY_DN8266_c0_g1~~TRINITY_DN8266_c0_g1_i1.p1  ORF type:complete len:164 (+),score=8.85 TRINITY_DN8266_c0_g1_i1:150-641(+)
MVFEVCNRISLRGTMILLHLLLSPLIFSSAIYGFVKSDLNHVICVLLLFISIFMITTELYGFKYFKQTMFMYSYGGRAICYVFVSLLIWSMYLTGAFFVAVVAVTSLICGLLSLVLAMFCSPMDTPYPVFGPPDFIPSSNRAQSLATKSDAENPTVTSNAFSL